MKIIKRNQVIVFVIGLMLITAGYLNFTNNGNQDINKTLQTGALADSEQLAEIGDAQLVSTQPASDSNLVEETGNVNTNQLEHNKNGENYQNITETDNIETNAEIAIDEYFSKSRLERDTMYSQMIESYQKILEKSNISEEQKSVAQNEIKKINEQKNAIMITENLLKTKDISDLIIFINDKSINVIVKSKKIQSEQIAQIQNIITRELKADISDIHISNKA